jgi:two-component system response regulator AtoC
MTDFRALIVDDEKTYATALARALKRRGIECEVAFDADGALGKSRSAGPFHVVLLDNRLPDTLGLRIIPRLAAIMPSTAIVMMTAYESIPDAVEAMRLGAEDYISKSTRTDPIVARVLEVRERLLARVGYDPSVPAGRDEMLLGQSDVMRQVRDRLEEVARVRGTPVLLIGEHGTGKGVAARYIHRRGHPPNAPFVMLNCASGPAGPADSMLFGRIRHTVSGSDVVESGILDSAGDGILYLDGIDESPDRLQKMLLGVLESRTFRRVGSSEEIEFGARVVASTRTHRLPGKLHERLHQRLNVFPVTLPPLRERGDDIVLLADLFIDHFNARMGKAVGHIDGPAAEVLEAYDFPGNVRELRNIVERAMILVKGRHIFPEHLPERVLRDGTERVSSIPPPDDAGEQPAAGTDQGLGIEFTPGVDTIDSVEKRLIVQAMELSGGVKSRAAKLLGISRFQLLRRLEKYGLESK